MFNTWLHHVFNILIYMSLYDNTLLTDNTVNIGTAKCIIVDLYYINS